MNRKRAFVLLYLVLLVLPVQIAYALTDADDDGQYWETDDCNDNDYYTYEWAVNIPYDGKKNFFSGYYNDSTMYDMDDTQNPSPEATYYLGDTIQIIGQNYFPNTQIRFAIIDPNNRSSKNSAIFPEKITNFNYWDTVFLNYTSIDASGNLNRTVTLWDTHPTGTYTIYAFFTWALGDDGDHTEWIPVDTFTVVENHAPNATITNITGAENTNITFNLPATDIDGDPLTYSSDNPNITWNGTHLYYEADYGDVIHPNLTKTVTVNITADDTRLTYTQEVNVTIIDVNRLPVLTPIGSKFINENELLSFNLNATDIESDPLTFDAQPLPAGATFTGNTFSWTPDPAQAGIHSINFSVTDGIDSVNETMQITVADLAGDYSGDSATDAWDITYLARSIAGISGYETLFSDDVSGDSNVDAWDITYLARAIAGISGYSV